MEARLAALVTWHRAVGLDPAQSVPLVAPLLELPVPAEYPPPPAAPEDRRRKLIATLAAWVTGGARAALVLHIEDIHWADPSTLDLLRVLAEQNVGVPLMLLIASRPEFRAPWPHRSHHSVVALAPLDRREVQEMVSEVAARHALSHQILDALVTRTGGVPLFVEEVTRLLLERNGPGAMQAIPATLQALLTARLDRLGSAKEVGQIAAPGDGRRGRELGGTAHAGEQRLSEQRDFRGVAVEPVRRRCLQAQRTGPGSLRSDDVL